MGRGNQLDRQWRLLQLIDRPAGVTVDGAARALDGHVRTIWRDVDFHAEEFRRRLPLKLGLAEVVATV